VLYCPYPPDATVAPWLQHCKVVSSPAQANFWVHPQLLREPAAIMPTLQVLHKTARRNGQPMLVLVLHDEAIPYIGCDWLIILRTSLIGKHRLPNEWPLPYSWESSDAPFVPAPQQAVPGISFCGQVNAWRSGLIEALQAAPNIYTAFLLQQQFWGGKPQDATLKQQFWHNLQSQPFAMAPRGEGNFSMRFYQALSVGRIPVLLDTDMPLPMADTLDWGNSIVMATSPADALAQMRHIIAEGSLVQRQQRCYELYHQHLSLQQYLPGILPQLMQQWPKPAKRWWQW
jgi:hypothetical protein